MEQSNLTISVIGLGYVGLPTAVAFHSSGFTVKGVDINHEIVERLISGESHLIDSTEKLELPKISERWDVTSDISEVVEETDIFLITVPTPVDGSKNPDLRFVKTAINSILIHMIDGRNKIIVVESTLYPGATMKIIGQLKEEMGGDYPKYVEIAYSPERVSPGDEGRTAREVAKIVGANSKDVGGLLVQVYSKITIGGCKYVGSIEVAEASKMIENTQRDIDIAFVNELAKTLPLMGLDVMEVIEAASTKWNFHRHTPGIGVGGHCIPVDPYYYIEASKNSGMASDISPVARKINESMPRHAVGQISDLQDGGSVAVFGVSYKPNIGDTRESPIFEFVRLLIQEGFKVNVWDPLVDDEEILPDGVKRFSDPMEAASYCGCIVLGTAHDKCLDLDWREVYSASSGKVIFDGPRMLSRKKMESIGWEYRGVGLPNEGPVEFN